MWRFFNFFSGEQSSDTTPELVISGDAENASNRNNNDDDDTDDKGGEKVVFTEQYENDEFQSVDDRDRRVDDEEFYQELSDSEPDSDFLQGCFEYYPLGEQCYVIRRVGSDKDVNILVHEKMPVVPFCYALQRYSDREMQRICSDDRAVDEKELADVARDADDVPTPLGVLGWFLQNGMNTKPVFSFDSEDAQRKKIIDLTAHTPFVTNPAIASAGNVSGVPLFENGHNGDDRITQAYRYALGIGNSDVLHGLNRRFLRRFQRYGRTARQSFDPSNEDDGFASVSPVTPTNGRWFVIQPQHYALYKSNEELVNRSGASISALAAALAADGPVLKELPTGVTQQQARAVFEQYLKEECVQKERERERTRSGKMSLLRIKCSQIIGLQESLRNLKLQAPSILSLNNSNPQSDINFLVQSLGEIDKILQETNADKLSGY